MDQLIAWAVPVFLLSIALEHWLARDHSPPVYERRDAWTSILMGLGAVVAGLPFRFLFLWVLTLLYSHRLSIISRVTEQVVFETEVEEEMAGLVRDAREGSVWAFGRTGVYELCVEMKRETCGGNISRSADSSSPRSTAATTCKGPRCGAQKPTRHSR